MKMPRYTFVCEDCGEYSEMVSSISEYDKSLAEYKCPHCKSKNVVRSYEDDNTYCSVKEIKTMMQLAEANEKKYGKELTAKMREDHKTKRKEGMKELPKGMSRINSASDMTDNYTKSDWKKKGRLK